MTNAVHYQEKEGYHEDRLEIKEHRKSAQQEDDQTPVECSSNCKHSLGPPGAPLLRLLPFSSTLFSTPWHREAKVRGDLDDFSVSWDF